jgi:hypothetical protein
MLRAFCARPAAPLAPFGARCFSAVAAAKEADSVAAAIVKPKGPAKFEGPTYSPVGAPNLQVPIVSLDGSSKGMAKLPEYVFAAPIRLDILHQ